MILLAMTLWCNLTWAGPIATHNKNYKELAGKILAYEKRVDDLIAKKSETKEGPDLENILTEISDIQKELVMVKKKRRELREHVKAEHPRDEVLDDLSILKDAESGKARKGGDPAMDKRLDDMLKKLRSQYARNSNREEGEFEYEAEQKAVEQELDKKKKNVQKETKDEYIRENIKTKLKVK